APVVGLGLYVDTEQPPEAVEVVDVAAAEARGEGLEGLVHGHAELPRLLAVEHHVDLGVARVERREDVADLRSLACGFRELPGELAEPLDAHAAALVLDQEVES